MIKLIIVTSIILYFLYVIIKRLKVLRKCANCDNNCNICRSIKFYQKKAMPKI